MLTVLLAGALLFGQGLPLPPPVPPPSVNVTSRVEVVAPPPDPEAIGNASVTSAQAIVVQLILPTLVGWANDALNLPDFWRTTPPEWTIQNPGVRGMAEMLRTVAMALLPLAIIAAGLMRALGQGVPEGRLFYGIVLAIGNLSFWEVGIGLNNAICNVIAAPPIKDIAKPHLTVPTLTANPAEAFGPAALVIVYAIVLLLLAVTLAFRIGFVDIFIVVGSVLLLCKSTEQTEGLMARYQQLSVSTLFSQVLIVVALKLAPVLGAIGAGFIGVLLGVVVLLLARRMPSMFAASHSQQASGGLLRFFVLRRFLPI